MDQFCFYVFKLLNFVSYICVFFFGFVFVMISSVMYIVNIQACQFKCSYDFSFFVFSVLSLGYRSVVALFCRSGCLYALCFWVLFNFNLLGTGKLPSFLFKYHFSPPFRFFFYCKVCCFKDLIGLIAIFIYWLWQTI